MSVSYIFEKQKIVLASIVTAVIYAYMEAKFFDISFSLKVQVTVIYILLLYNRLMITATRATVFRMLYYKHYGAVSCYFRLK